MTLQEFNQLTGLNVSEKEFDGINEMYMAAVDMDKATFCKEYMLHGKNQLVAALMNRVRDCKVDKDEMFTELSEFCQERSKLVDFLLEQSQELGSRALLKKAIDMVGHADVIRKKIELGLTLCELDLDYIRENL